MEQYIPKSVLLTEIERLKTDALQKKNQCKRSGLERIMQQIGAYNKILSILDTLEVKEIDLEKEIDEHWDDWAKEDGFHSVEFAKHFFEIGINIQKGE